MLEITDSARKFLSKLPPKKSKQVTSKVFALLKEPYPTDCKHLSLHPGYRRVDIGEYRICYKIQDSVVKIAVVGKRNDDSVYKKLKRKSL